MEDTTKLRGTLLDIGHDEIFFIDLNDPTYCTWLRVNLRVLDFLPKFKQGDVVYVELKAGKVDYLAHDKGITPSAQNKPKFTLTVEDRVLIARECLRAATRLQCAIIAASFKEGNPAQLETIAINATNHLAGGLEAGIKQRLGVV
jgi:hypothetical protein